MFVVILNIKLIHDGQYEYVLWLYGWNINPEVFVVSEQALLILKNMSCFHANI